MRLEDYALHVTGHALKRYRERVGPISFDDLTEECSGLIAHGDYEYKDEYILIGDIWWMFATKEKELHLVTCYGHLFVDLPKAVKWARRFKDRINLYPGGEVLCDGER